MLTRRDWADPVRTERLVLGAALLSDGFADRLVRSHVMPHTLSFASHRLALDAVRRLRVRAAPVDVVTVVEELRARGHSPPPADPRPLTG
jgi:replicative DNA helicase